MRIDKNGGTQFDGLETNGVDKSITKWDPFMALIVNSSGEAQTPALQFLHELKHARDFRVDSKAHEERRKEDDSQMKNKEEKRVIDDTNNTAQKIGEPIRTGYYNVKEKKVTSPTKR